MPKKKGSNKSKGKRLDDESKKQLLADINSGMETGALMKKYRISDVTVGKYRKLAERQKKERPPSVMDMAKILNLTKAQSLLVYTMEQMETAMKRIDEDREKHTPKTQADTAVHCGRLILEIHNTILLTETPDMPEGYTPDDVEVSELMMEMLTEKQKEELFAKFTGKSLAEITTGKPGSNDDKA